LTGLSANSWYRLRATITKLNVESAKIEVTLTTLDGSGNPGTLVASGSIQDTSLLPDTTENYKPKPGYFTAATMYPAFKNHNGTAGNADNAYFEILTGTPPVQHNLIVTTAGSGSVTLDPAGGTYDEGTVVALDPVPVAGWEFAGWSGANSGDLSDNGDGTWSITMNATKEVTATFTALSVTCYVLTVGHTGSGSDPSVTPANSSGCPSGQYLAGR